jgi:hypothetical protein
MYINSVQVTSDPGFAFLKVASYIKNAQNSKRTERTVYKDWKTTWLGQNGGESQANCVRNLLRMLGGCNHGRNKVLIHVMILR